jgi:hypothetical protein
MEGLNPLPWWERIEMRGLNPHPDLPPSRGKGLALPLDKLERGSDLGLFR